jgi:ABC-type Na+ transport system ATPase subunit NatA
MTHYIIGENKTTRVCGVDSKTNIPFIAYIDNNSTNDSEIRIQKLQDQVKREKLSIDMLPKRATIFSFLAARDIRSLIDSLLVLEEYLILCEKHKSDIMKWERENNMTIDQYYELYPAAKKEQVTK